MTTPDRFGKFSGVDYNPSGEVSRELAREAAPSTRPARGLQNQRDRARAINMARGAGNALDRTARGVQPAGRGSQMLGAAARGAMRAPDSRVRAAGAVVNRVVQAHDVAAANGVDIPGRARDFVGRVTQRIQQRPARERGFFTKLTQKFGNRAHSLPEEGENVAQYGERMMTAERDERLAANEQVDQDSLARGGASGGVSRPALGAAQPGRPGAIARRQTDAVDVRDMDAFIASSRKLGAAIAADESPQQPDVIDGEVVAVHEIDTATRPQTMRDRRINDNGATARTAQELVVLERDFDAIDAQHDFATTAGTYAVVDDADVDARTRAHTQAARDAATKRKNTAQRDRMFDEFNNNEFGGNTWVNRVQEHLREREGDVAPITVAAPLALEAGAGGSGDGAGGGVNNVAAGGADAGDDGVEGQAIDPDNQAHLDAMREASRTLQRDAARTWAETDAKNNPFNAENIDKPTSQARDQMRKSHDRYAGMMMMSAIAPLRNGINAESIVGVAGSLAVMWALSPKFREFTEPYLDKLIRGNDAHAEDKAADEKKGFLRKSLDDRKRSAKRAAQHIFGAKSAAKRMQSSDPAHAPYQVDSAATQLVNLSENAYEAMREPKANEEVILRKYGKLTDELERDWEDQGLNRKDVYERARWIVGQQMLDDPTVASRYIDTATGNVHMSDNVERRTRTKDGWLNAGAWDGRWVAGVNHDVEIGRSAKFFTPRGPRTPAYHAMCAEASMTNVMRTCMRDSLSEKVGFNEFTTTMAVMTPRNEEFGDVIDTINVNGVSYPSARGVQTMQSLRAAMRADGLTQQEMNAALQEGMDNAMQKMYEEYPEQMQQYESRLQQINGGEHETADSMRRRQSARVLTDPDKYLHSGAGAHVTRAQPAEHIATGMADYRAQQQEASAPAAEHAQDGGQSEHDDDAQRDAADTSVPHAGAAPAEPVEDAQDVQLINNAPDETASHPYGKDMVKQAMSEQRRAREQEARNRRRAAQNAARQQHATDNTPEL